MTSERGSEVEVRIRPFRARGLATAVHRWFNNREAISSLMEVRDVVRARERQGLDERRGRAGGDEGGEDRKWAIEVEGIDEPVGFTALYGLFRQTAPELGALIGDDPGARGVGREAERLTVAKAFDEFGAHRVYGRIPAFNGPAKKAVTWLGWQHEGTMPEHIRRPDGTLIDCEVWGISAAGWRERWSGGADRESYDRRGRADRRRGRGGRRDRRVLPQPRVLRRRGRSPTRSPSTTARTALRPAARPRDPGDRSPRCDLALLLSRRAGRAAARSIRRRSTWRLRARQRLRPRPPRRAARVHRRHRPLGRPRLRPGRAAQVADERSSADPQERGGRLRDLVESRAPTATAADLAGFLAVYTETMRARRRRRALLLRRRLLPDAARLAADLADHGHRPRTATAPPPRSPSAATASSTTTSRAPPTRTAAGPR